MTLEMSCQQLPKLALLVTLLAARGSHGGHYLNQYAVDILDGQDPDVVAKESGCENTGEHACS